MELGGYLRMLRRRWKFLTATVLLGLAAAIALTLLPTPVYRAQVQLFVATKSDRVDDLNQGALFSQQRVKSYVDLIRSPIVTRGVISALSLDMTATDVERRITVEAPLDTVVLNVWVEDTSAKRAAAIANTTAIVFTGVVGDVEQSTTSGQPPVKVTTLRTAEVPTSPVSPQPKLNVAIGLLGGLVLGVGGAVLTEALDTSVTTPDDLDTLVGVETIGVISRTKKRRGRRRSPGAGGPSQRDEFQQLRTNLQFMDTTARGLAVVVTSASPDEGKTTVAVNLGRSLARAGVGVCLVEGDLRNATFRDLFDLESKPGLPEVLQRLATLDEALQVQEGGLLQILPGSFVAHDPTWMLELPYMAEIIAALKQRASFVIIDSPPLVAFADAAVLAAHAGNALLVVRSRKTRRGELIELVNTLDRVHARVLGAIFNMVDSRGPDTYPTRRRRPPDVALPARRPRASSLGTKARRGSPDPKAAPPS